MRRSTVARASRLVIMWMAAAGRAAGLGGHHLVDPLHRPGQQLIELQARQVGGRSGRCFPSIVRCGLCSIVRRGEVVASATFSVSR